MASLSELRRQDSLQQAFFCSLVPVWRVSPQLLCFGEVRLLIISGISIRQRTSSLRRWAVRLGFSSCCSARPSPRQQSPPTVIVGSDLQLLPALLIQKGLWAAPKITFPVWERSRISQQVSGHEKDGLGKSAFMHAVS